MNGRLALGALTLINCVLLITSGSRFGAANPQDVAPVLRGHALEIVDAHGQVRASITVIPADSTVRMPDGTRGYPEAVLLRLRDSRGRPNVKIQAVEDGAGIVLGGDVDPTYVQLLARGSTTSVRLSNKDGREQLIKP